MVLHNLWVARLKARWSNNCVQTFILVTFLQMAFLIRYPETESFRDVVTYATRHNHRYRRDLNEQLTVVKFIGTVKLHGAIASIVYQQDLGHWYQSRNRVTTATNDDDAFVQHIDLFADQFFRENILPCCSIIRERYERGGTIVIYGEWCGEDIQSDVAITGLIKMFVVFKVRTIDAKHRKIDEPSTSVIAENEEQQHDHAGEFWLAPEEWSKIECHERSVYNIYDFPTYEINVDFNLSNLSVDLLSNITEKIEQQCPVGTYFGRSGHGEDVVWTEWIQTHGDLTFKVKSHKHSVTEADTLASIGVFQVTNIQELVEYACTENRMHQVIDFMHEDSVSIELKNLSTFLRLLAEDIIKEEKDTMDAAHISAKEVMRAITNKAQGWFSERILRDHKAKAQKKRHGNK